MDAATKKTVSAAIAAVKKDGGVAPKDKNALIESEENEPVSETETPDAEDDTSDNGGEAASKSTTAKEDDAPEFDSSLIDRAKRMGLSEDDLYDIGTAEVAERLIGRLEKVQPAPKAEPTKNGQSDDDLGFDLGDYAEDEHIKGAFSATTAKIKQLEQELATLRNGTVERDEKSLSDRLSALVKGLDQEWSDTFDRRTRQGRRNFSLVRDEFRATTQRKPSLSDTDVLQRVLRAEFGEKTASLAQKVLSDKLSNRSKQHIHRPTHAQGTPKSPMQAAIYAAADIMRAKGADPGELNWEDEAEGLPD
jgi:hypothetical protein